MELSRVDIEREATLRVPDGEDLRIVLDRYLSGPLLEYFAESSSTYFDTRDRLLAQRDASLKVKWIVSRTGRTGEVMLKRTLSRRGPIRVAQELRSPLSAATDKLPQCQPVIRAESLVGGSAEFAPVGRVRQRQQRSRRLLWDTIPIRIGVALVRFHTVDDGGRSVRLLEFEPDDERDVPHAAEFAEQLERVEGFTSLPGGKASLLRRPAGARKATDARRRLCKRDDSLRKEDRR